MPIFQWIDRIRRCKSCQARRVKCMCLMRKKATPEETLDRIFSHHAYQQRRHDNNSDPLLFSEHEYRHVRGPCKSVTYKWPTRSSIELITTNRNSAKAPYHNQGPKSRKKGEDSLILSLDRFSTDCHYRRSASPRIDAEKILNRVFRTN